MTNMPEQDQVQTDSTGEQEIHSSWTPVIGPEVIDFLQSAAPEGSRESICEAAVSILSKGIPPFVEEGQETGLVVGYVQSGKTLSFETVAALARDNGFQMVIVLAGTSNPLLDQSAGRLRRDLGLDDPRHPRRWVQFQNPTNNDATLQAIRDVLEDWRDSSTPPQYKRTVLVTVLKHYQRLQNVTALTRALEPRGIPVLIVDDEADQASLNTEVAQGRESSTYRRLMELRQSLPNHTYLQYTATPQAPLLISIIDAFSPNFVQVLEPGAEYVGGHAFFIENPELVQPIPPHEVPTRANPLSEPPDSLMDALRVFMLGVTAGLMQEDGRGNRSMLVHPSHSTTPHEEYYRWVRNIFEEWKRILNLPDSDPDKLELIAEFQSAYNDLSGTVRENLPALGELVQHLRFAFRNTRILEVNARGGRTPSVDWRGAYGWILVGGQAMDRGFTVEGLTVTYMPRGVGVGNADTVQQRARFFGYKRNYLGYCRVYLEQSTITAFQNYVEHEEDIRSQLQQFQANRRPLNEWKRAFILSNALRPCRHNVLQFDYMQGRYSDEWVSPRVVFAADNVVSSNRSAVTEFIRGVELLEDEGHPHRTETQRHQVSFNVSLGVVIEQLLVRLRITGTTDSQRYTGLLLQLSKAWEENPQEVCTVYRMSPTIKRHRSIDEDGEISNLFQGEAPVHPLERRGEIYPGDRAIRHGDQVTIQIHTLTLTRDGTEVAEDVPVVAVWVPARLARSWVAQEQDV